MYKLASFLLPLISPKHLAGGPAPSQPSGRQLMAERGQKGLPSVCAFWSRRKYRQGTGGPFYLLLACFPSILLSFKICCGGERAWKTRTVCSVLLLEAPKAVTAGMPEFSQRSILFFRTRPPVPVEMYFSEPGL